MKKTKAELEGENKKLNAEKQARRIANKENQEAYKNREKAKKRSQRTFMSNDVIWEDFLALKDGFAKYLDKKILSQGDAFDMLVADYLKLKGESPATQEPDAKLKERCQRLEETARQAIDKIGELQTTVDRLEREKKEFKDATGMAFNDAMKIGNLEKAIEMRALLDGANSETA